MGLPIMKTAYGLNMDKPEKQGNKNPYFHITKFISFKQNQTKLMEINKKNTLLRTLRMAISIPQLPNTFNNPQNRIFSIQIQHLKTCPSQNNYNYLIYE